MRWKLSEKRALWLLIGVYFVIFGLLTSLRHYNFHTQAWDLAAFVQSFWNAVHGQGLINNLEQVENHLGIHWSPFLFLLVPFYFFFRSPYTLLLLQTAALALGALPLYSLAKRVLNSQPLSYMIVALYLLYPGLQWTNMYDFHEISFFLPLFLSALYFIEAKRWGWAGLFLVLSATVKEDAILVVLFAGIYVLFMARRHSEAEAESDSAKPKNLKRSFTAFRMTSKSFGILIIILALVYFLLATKVFMPAVGGGVLRFDRYANLGENPTAIVKNVVNNPGLLGQTLFDGRKLSYLFWLFLPVVFLPFFQWRAWILLIPGLAENLLTNYHFQFSGLYHYDAILIPGIFVGAIYGLNNVILQLRSETKKSVVGEPVEPLRLHWIVLSMAIIVFLIRSPLGLANFPIDYFRDSPIKTAYRNMVRLVPKDKSVSVAALTNLVPHLAHRDRIHALGSETGLMDMVLADLQDRFGFKDETEFKTYLENYLKSGLYKGQLFDDRYLVIIHNKLKFME